MAHDVFISYSHEEAEIAMSVLTGLEEKNIKCWISSRDIPAGTDYAEQIMYGINHCRLVLLILSTNTSKSKHVIRELDRALSKKIEILPFRIEDVELSASMEYYVSTSQWLDALTPPLESHIEKLANEIKKIFVKQKKDKTNKAISSGRKFFNVKNYIEAKKQFEIVKEIDSENKDAIYYLSEIDRLVHKKTEMITNNIAFCKESLEAKNPVQARVYINKVLELDKENEEALALKEEVQKLEKDRQKLITQGIEAGKKALHSKNYNQAIKYLREVFELDRANQEVRELLSESEKFEREKQKRIVQLLDLGKEALKVDNFKQSIDHFRNVLELEKENREALSYLTRINQIEKKRKLKIAETLTLATRLLKSNYKNKAKELFEEVLRLDPKNKEAFHALNEIRLGEIPSPKKISTLNVKKVSIGIGLIGIVLAISAYLYFRPEPYNTKTNAGVTKQPEVAEKPAAEVPKPVAKAPEAVAEPPKPVPVAQSEDIAKRLGIVKDHLTKKDLRRAKTDILIIVNQVPDNNQAQDLKKQIFLLENEVTQLSALAQEAQATDKYIKAREYYMEILEIDKDNETAIKELEPINLFIATKINNLLASAGKDFKAKNLNEARRQYSEVLDLDPEDKKAHKSISQIDVIREKIAGFIEQGKTAALNENYSEAEKNYRKALALEPKNKAALKGIKEIKAVPVPEEPKPAVIALKEQKLEISPESKNRLNFGRIKEEEKIEKTIEIQSYLKKQIVLKLSDLNWLNKNKPKNMKPRELFTFKRMILKPNESGILHISLKIPKGSRLPDGLYKGDLIFKDKEGESEYKISFVFNLNS